MSNKDINLQIDDLIQDVRLQQKVFVKKMLLELTKAVIMGTPVDEGRAKGNWQASINTPIDSEVKRVDKSGGVTFASASEEIEKAAGNLFILQNNLPYIERLEYEGWSNVQAPNGWVRKAIDDIKVKFQ